MSWTLKISKQARADLDYFRAYDSEIYRNCYELSKAVVKDPFSGPGKPLKLSGARGEVWFRRTSLEHRMVYQVFDNLIIVASYRTHID
jgi:toxin YoeB